MEQGNRSHGKIDRLPQAVKREVENQIVNHVNYKDISSYLKENGHDVSYSAVSRYGRKFMARFESVRIAKDFAKLLAEDNVDRPATELHEANNLLASQLIMEAMVNDEMKAEDRAKIAKSIASLQNAQIANEKLKQNARKEQGAIHTAMRLFTDKIYEEIGSRYPEVAQTLLALAEETEMELSRMQ